MITTIIMPVSRKDYLARIFAQLDMMPCNAEETNLLVYVDGDTDLFMYARNFVAESKFKEKLCVYRRKGLPNVNHIKHRRERIAAIHNELKTIVGVCDYVFLMEDDTLLPLNAFEKLLKHATALPHAGFVTGVQIGRWGMTVPGIWRVDNPYDVKKIESCLPIVTEYPEHIDAAGLFCCMTKAELYKKCDFKPFDSILGPDISYGLYLRQEGYRNYVDWSINTSHLTKRGEIKVYNTVLQKITFTKLEEGRWAQELI